MEFLGITVLLSAGPVSDWTLLEYNRTRDFDYQILQGGNALERPTGDNYTRLEAKMFLGGYSYRAEAVTDYLSIVVLMVHVLMALGHTIRLLYFKRTSSAWGSIAERLALSLNSRPATNASRNTSAGINHFDTYKKVAKTRASHESHDVDELDDFTTEEAPKHPEIMSNESAKHTPIEMDSLISNTLSVQVPRAWITPVQSNHKANSSTSSSTFSLHRSYPPQTMSPRWIRKSISSPSLCVTKHDELYGS